MRYLISLAATGVGLAIAFFFGDWIKSWATHLDVTALAVAATAGAILLVILAEAALVDLLEGGRRFPTRDALYSWSIGGFSEIGAGFCVAVLGMVVDMTFLIYVILFVPVGFVSYVKWQDRRRLVAA